MKINKTKILVALSVFTVLAVLFFGYQRLFDVDFYPRVSIAGENVSGKTYDEVFEGFRAKIAALENSGLKIVFKGATGDRNIDLPKASSGLTSDTVIDYWKFGNWEDAVKRAYNWGRSDSFFKNIVRQGYSLLFGVNFKLPVEFYEENVIAFLEREAEEILPKPESAKFEVVAEEVRVIPEKKGEEIDIKKVAKEAHEALMSVNPGPITFAAEIDNPEISASDLTRFIPLAEALSKKGRIVLYHGNHKWPLAGKTVVSWLTLKSKNEVGVDIGKLEAFVKKNISPAINNPPQNSRFQFINGKIVEIMPGRPGNVVDVKATAERIEKIIPDVQKSFEATGSIFASLESNKYLAVSNESVKILIEVTEQEPKITRKTIDQYKIKNLIGTARTNFTGGSAARQHNIEVGVSKLNGLLIEPGEEFSTVKNIGPANEDGGFQKEYVIKQDRTVKEWGGGLCQVATTLFRTILNAGLKVTQRTNHSFIISYYGPGLDATIYSPSPDLRFVNDTGNYILLQGRAIANEVVFELYGLNDGRKVHISKPVISNIVPAPGTKYVETADLAMGQTRCSEIPKNGLTADVTYTVTYRDGRINKQRFHSVYEPWQKVCLVGIGSPSAVSSGAAE